MARMLTLPFVAPPDTLRVEVAYYDEEERLAFQKALGRDILGASSFEVVIPTPDFCANYLCYKIRPGVPGFGTRDDVVARWRQALAEIDGQLAFEGGSVRLIRAEGTSKATSERFGEAIGLSVVSQLHNLHEGDWVRIPETNTRKTLDFRRPIASDGQQVIMLEAKGSSVEDNRMRPSAVSGHKMSIKDKKSEALPEERANSVLYGTIAVLDARLQSTARCLLVDPPAGVNGDPIYFKLLARLEYMARYATLLGPRSQLAAALWTRLAALRVTENYGALDGVRLRTGSDAEYSAEAFDQTGRHGPWFGSKSVVSDGPVGGQVFAVDKQIMLFIAIHEDLVPIAAAQDFRAIREYTFPAGIVKKTVECSVSVGRARSEFARFMQIPQQQKSTKNGYVRFAVDGQLYYCKSGVVFGVLPIPEAWRTTS